MGELDANALSLAPLLVIVDRLKDMYISGGENVYPAEIEAVLRQVEGVVDAAVIGVADPRWGEVGVAFIETATQAFTPGDLVAVQRGDGSVNLGSSGYLVFLDEYTTSGVLVQQIALPNVDLGSNHALLLSGQNGAARSDQRATARSNSSTVAEIFGDASTSR